MNTKIKLIAILILSTFSKTILHGQGIDFFHGTWEDAIKLAQKEEKFIFVDAYASWCGPCKRMASTVFTDKGVGEFMNKNYVSLKLDMEKDPEGVKFGQKFSVSAYPSLFFINDKGELIQKEVGGKSVEDFLKVAKFIFAKADVNPELAKAYESGNRDPKFIKDYIKALNKASKPSLKVTNDYLSTQKNLETEDNLNIIFEGAVESDSKVFDYLIKYKSKIIAIVGEDAYLQRVDKACIKTGDKAIEYKSERLLEEAIDKIKANDPKNADSIINGMELSYYEATKDTKSYLKAASYYTSKIIKSEPSKLHDFVLNMVRAFPNDNTVLNEAEKYAKKAASTSQSYEHYLTYGSLLYKNSKKKEAITALQKSIDLAKNEGKPNPQAESLLMKIKEN